MLAPRGVVVVALSMLLAPCGARGDRVATSNSSEGAPGSRSAGVAAGQERIQYDTRTFAQEAGTCGAADEPEPCTRVAFTWIDVIAAPADAAAAINGPTLEWLRRPVFEDDGGTPEEIAAALQRTYEELRAEFSDYALPWHIERTVTVERDAPRVFALAMYEDMFTGGAHGARTLRYRNHRPDSGAAIDLTDLLVDGGIVELTAIAERIFRRDKEILPGSPLADAGFWFDDGTFALNDNFLIADDGLLFHFNEYEIAPYAAGHTDLLIPWVSMEHLLRADANVR